MNKETGASLVAYAILLSLICLASIVGVKAFSIQMKKTTCFIIEEFDSNIKLALDQNESSTTTIDYIFTNENTCDRYIIGSVCNLPGYNCSPQILF